MCCLTKHKNNKLFGNSNLIKNLKKMRKVIGAIFFVTSTFFIGYILYINWEEITLSINKFSVSTLSLAILSSLLMLFFKGIYNERMITSLSGERKFNFTILYSYSVSQLVRYIPGKIWGVLYQNLHLSGLVSAQAITIGNILQYIYTNIFSVLIILSIALMYFGFEVISFIIFIISLLIIRYPHNDTRVNNFIIKKLGKITKIVQSSPSTIKTEFSVTLLLLDWIFYIAIWAIILPDTAHSMDFLYLSALYASASLLSLIAVFSPGGLAVRETLFFFLGTYLGYNEESLLIYGLLLRIILTTSEVLLVFSLTPFRRTFYAYR